MAGPDEEVLLLDHDGMMRLWLYDKLRARALTEAQADAIWREHQTKTKAAANYGATIDDARSIYKLARDMRSPLGKVYFKNYGGKVHVVLKGNPRLRTILTGTRYGVRNAKVVGMGLGKHGVIKSAKGGTIITVIAMTTWNIVDFFMRDEATLGQLFGSIAADITKAVIAGVIGAAVGAAVAGTVVIGTIAIGPLVVGVGVGLIAGALLDQIDERYQLTQRLQRACERGLAEVEATVARGWRSVLQGAAELLEDFRDGVIDSARDYVVREARRRFIPLIPQLLPRW